jgi:tRNA(Arg) A34 adenosine deaminase TadA
MSELPDAVRLDLPDWVATVARAGDRYPGDGDKVALAVELSRRNVEAGTGGPFGAAVFGPDDALVAVGVNRVLPRACSVAHAETMAFMLAQQAVGRSRLNRDDATGAHVGAHVLATSAQPCCQCYGACFWAGIDRLLVGARSEDVMALTEFDEGPLPSDWRGELERRGIALVRDLHRDAACEVLRGYGRSGGTFY